MEQGLFRITIPDYDPRAFREALVNAFCHRDYSVLGRVLIQITDEGMTISNPGGFIEGIRADNLLDAEHYGRNPALADAMKRIGLAERTGRGIDRIFEGSLLYGRLLPDYSNSTQSSVKLFIPKGPTDKAFICMVSEEQQRLGRSLPIHLLLALDAVKQLHRASVQDVAERIHTDESRVRVVLETLVESGLVERLGNGRGRYYIMSSRYSKETNSTVGYVRNRDIDALRHQELVIQLAQTKGEVTRADVVELLHVTPPQAYRILQKLKDAGQLSLEGKRRRSQVSHDKIETNARVRFCALLLHIYKKHPGYNLPTESFRHGREKTSGRAFRILSFLSSLSQRIKTEPTKLCTTFSKHGALYP